MQANKSEMAYRLFIAIELPDSVKNQLLTLRANISGATWVKPHGYHLTLRFLGDGIEAAKLEAIKASLTEVVSPAFAFQLQGVGRFPPNPQRGARVLWVGVSAPPALKQLYQRVEQTITELGFLPEGRDFNPHITLARLKSYKPDPKVEQFLQAHRNFRSETIRVSAFHLFSSVLSPQGAAYTTEATFLLEGS